MTKRELKRILKKKTGCAIQHDGWPCGTCFGSLLESLHIDPDSTKAEVLWQSLLVYRGDYKLGDIVKLDQVTIDTSIAELKTILTVKG